MIKKTFFTFLLLTLTTFVVIAQKRCSISAKELKGLIGCWQGTLNYSGTHIRKPYSTTAQLEIKQIGKLNQFQLLHQYTEDPNDKSTDTVTISKDGRRFDKQIIKSKRTSKDGTVQIVTEAPSFDHNNTTPVIVRCTYAVGKSKYSFKKQVQRRGQTDWLDREEFNYTRKICKSKKV